MSSKPSDEGLVFETSEDVEVQHMSIHRYYVFSTGYAHMEIKRKTQEDARTSGSMSGIYSVTNYTMRVLCPSYSTNSLFREFFRKFGGVCLGVFETT